MSGSVAELSKPEIKHCVIVTPAPGNGILNTADNCASVFPSLCVLLQETGQPPGTLPLRQMAPAAEVNAFLGNVTTEKQEKTTLSP